MSSGYQLPTRISLARWILRPSFRIVFRLLSNVKLAGRENIPGGGAYLIAANHVSLYDPPVILAFWPVAAEAVGAVEVWQRRGQSTLVRWYGAIPVHRDAYDRYTLNIMQSALTAGRPLLILPEGSRSHSPGMQRAEPGVAFLVEKTSVPVVPVGVVGTTDDFLKRALNGKRPSVQINIGAPLNLPPLDGKGETRRLARQQNADFIMERIAALLPFEYRGVYAGSSGPLA